jgi:hypothetical protein
MDWNILLYLIDCSQIEFHAHIIMLTHGRSFLKGRSAIRLTNACKAKDKRNIFFSKKNDGRR